MKLLNTLVKITQGYIACKICIILYLVHYYPKQHSIDEVLWWVTVLVLDMWLNTVVFKSDTIILNVKKPNEES